MTLVRAASHAGTWYSGNRTELEKQMTEWLGAASASTDANLDATPSRAIIAPHAGYSYSGPAAAYSYRFLTPEPGPRRVFILGPSHHVYLEGCALSGMDEYETPLGNLKLDAQVISELKATGAFEKMSRSVDEDEHSIEMQLPYIAKMMQGTECTIIPILVGNLTVEKELEYGHLLAPYLAQPNNIFVISSDFCHWGKRFSFQHYNPSDGAIHESIEALDRQGMSLIERQDTKGFAEYLRKYKNTICGRHPIGVLLNALDALRSSDHVPHRVVFTHYTQSSPCVKPSDSSVSYAAATVVEDPGQT